MDEEIENTVSSMFGKDAKIVDCQKSSSVIEEEVLLINGIPIKLDGISEADAVSIKTAINGGQMPSIDLLNQLLCQAGILQQPVQIETSLSVKSSVITSKEVSVSRHGKVLDETTSVTKENNVYKSNKTEIWQPILQKDLATLPQSQSHKCDVRDNGSTSMICNLNKTNSEKSKNDSSDKNYKYTSSRSIVNCSSMGDCSDASSIMSDYSTHRFSNASIRCIDSFASNSSPLSHAKYNSRLDECKKKFSTLSCDSGHDGIFQSSSQNTVYDQWNLGDSTNSIVSSVSNQLNGIPKNSAAKDLKKSK